MNRFSGLAIRILTIPVILRYLGTERYGLWMTIASATGYVALIDLGTSSALVNKLTRYYQLGLRRRASTLLVGATTLLAVVSGAIFVVAILALPLADLPRLLHLTTGAAVSEVHPTVVVAVLMACLQLSGSVILKAPYTMQKGHLTETGLLAGNLVGLAGILGGVYLGLKLPFLAGALMAPPVVAAVAVAVHLVVRGQLSVTWPGVRRFRAIMSVLRRTAPSYAVLQGAASLMVALQFTLLAFYRGVAAVAAYGLIGQAVMAAQLPLTVLQHPLWTRLAALFHLGDLGSVRKMVLQYLRVALVYSTIAGTMIIFLVNPGLSFIMKNPLVIELDLRLAFAVLCALGLLVGGNLGSVILAMGLSRAVALLAVAQVSLLVVVAIILVPRYGAVGMALSVIASFLIAVPVQLKLVYKGLRAGGGVSRV